MSPALLLFFHAVLPPCVSPSILSYHPVALSMLHIPLSDSGGTLSERHALRLCSTLQTAVAVVKAEVAAQRHKPSSRLLRRGTASVRAAG